MKFLTESVARCAARIGVLTEFERIPDAIFETPLVLIYTKRGAVPHLTKDVFKMVTTNNHILSTSLPSTMCMADVIKELGTSFPEFVSMKEYINFLSIHDSAERTNSGFQQLDSISVWDRTGRHLVDANKYMDIVESLKPDFYVALCDGDTNIDSSKKRTVKAVARSNSMLEQCLKRHQASNLLKTKGILAAIEGGYNIEAREDSINHLKNKPVLGYVIDGLHNNERLVSSIPSEQVSKIVEHSLNLLPPEKLKVSMGCWSPDTVLDLIELGVDVFDTTYPYIATEKSEALTFLCDHHSCCNSKHVRNLDLDSHKDDFAPICKECECLTCKNHTRAYLHHLCQTKEMLHMVLLMIHNVHQYIQFFSKIREHIRNGTFGEFRNKINSRFPERK